MTQDSPRNNFFQTKHSQLPGNFNHTNEKPPTTNSVPRPSAFLQHSCGRFRPPRSQKVGQVSLPQQPSADSSHGIPPCFSTDFSHPPSVFATPTRAPMRSSCCTWSSCGNKPKKQRSRDFLLILAYFLPPSELRIASLLLLATCGCNQSLQHLWIQRLRCFFSHACIAWFFAIVHHGERRQDKNQQFKVFKKGISDRLVESSHTFWTAASSCFNGETILLKTSFPLTNLGGFWEERYWPPTKTLIHLTTIEKFGASPFSEGHIWTACFHNTDQSPFILYLKNCRADTKGVDQPKTYPGYLP